tara:strand:- start:888 stop:2087 length:1200 start_codon:yes stop_codon:yes gene_type:complete
METHYQLIIIGAGTAGIMTAAQLRKKDKTLKIALLDPSEFHYYQPAWTLVGAGTYDYKQTRRTTQSVIPKGVQWIKDKVREIHPERNQMTTESDKAFSYDYLIVAPGLVYDLSMVEGLERSLEAGIVCSNYINPDYTWECLQKFKGGKALFTLPNTPIKCGGAPQKIMYLAADYFRKKGISSSTQITYAYPGGVIFGVKEIAQTLLEVVNRYKIRLEPLHFLYKIDPNKRIAFFRKGEVSVEMPFDFLHLAPPQTAPPFIKNSTLANEAGWLDVDIHSMQHRQYANIFGLGDVAALPTAKTGAAIRKQAPIVVDNILKMINGSEADNKSYTGYSSCPLVTGYGKMVLAEFNYKNEFTPDPQLKKMLISDSSKEHWRLWLLKKYMLPYLYWNKMLKGKAV